jgi:hypothetical protein
MATMMPTITATTAKCTNEKPRCLYRISITTRRGAPACNQPLYLNSGLFSEAGSDPWFWRMIML